MKEIIRMNQLAGLITEGQAKKMIQILNESSLDLKVKFTPEYIKNEKQDLFYTEKGLADGFEIMNGKKVKAIVGYFEDENGDEDIETIGYIYSTSGKDISSYSEDDLDKAFVDAL
jgi:hypothetical protein